jgi:hypothetical protein
MALRMQNRSFSRAHALARLSPAATLAASAVLGMGLVMGCNAPVSPTFELHFLDSNLGDASCNAAAMEDVRLMCDSTVRVRILDAGGRYDLVPPVCRDLDSAEIGTMESLEQLDVDFAALPLGEARFRIEVWRAGLLGPASCGGSSQGQAGELAPSEVPGGPAVVGQARFVIGEDAHVRVPLECPALEQVNRFAPGCSLDVDVGDLDRGTKLRRPARSVEREDPAMIEEETRQDDTESEISAIEIDDLQVVYGFAQNDASGWEFNAQGRLDLHDHTDGSVVWRYRPNDYFWTLLDEHKTLCIQVTRGNGEPPQLSCIEAESESPSARVQASYLPPEDLACLLAANGASNVPEAGIVMGRVVEPAVENTPPNLVQELPAANVQVFPTSAELPEQPDPLLKLAAAGETDDEFDDRDDASGENVQYVSKDPDVPSRTASACRVDDTSATTSSGYFLSDASFPAHWEVETGSRVNEGTDKATTDGESARTLVGGRIPGTVSIVRIPLR